MRSEDADKRKPTTFNLTDTASAMLNDLARYHGISRTAWVELMIRAEARKLGLAE